MGSLLEGQSLWIIGATVALAGVFLFLAAWQWFQHWQRKRQVRSSLQRIAPDAEAALEGEGDDSILRQQASEFDWLAPLVRWLPRRHDLEILLQQADQNWSVEGYLVLSLASAAGVGTVSMALGLPAEAAAAVGVGGGFIPYLILRRKRSKRYSEFEEHFPDAIDLLGRSVKAGHAFSTGLQVMVDESPDPVSSEFRQVFEEQRYGMPIRDSLLALADRVDLLDVRIFVTSILIQRDTGGNLAEILDNLSEIIRQRFRFRRQIKTQTAHGRMTSYILGAAPVVAALGLWAVSPEYMAPLIEEPMGHMLIGFAVVSQIIGFVAVRRIVDVEF